MGERIKKLKKIRIHREGTNELFLSALAIVGIATLLWYSFSTTIPFWIFIVIFGTAWAMALNFYRCPIRYFNGDTEKLVVAPADGKIVVVEEAEENEYFHDKRLMISIFMSPLNVHANWFPIDGKVKFVHHQDGNYHKAWLPKASEENEHADIITRPPDHSTTRPPDHRTDRSRAGAHVGAERDNSRRDSGGLARRDRG